MNHKPRVLFFSTGDASRSRMAEGFLEEFAGNEVIAVSTAVESVSSDPLTQEVMKEAGVDISNQQPKEVADSLKEHFAYVVTLSDSSRERSPVWPFTRNIIKWSLIDPERVAGPVDQKRRVFRDVRDDIRNKVHDLLREIHPQLHSAS